MTTKILLVKEYKSLERRNLQPQPSEDNVNRPLGFFIEIKNKDKGMGRSSPREKRQGENMKRENKVEVLDYNLEPNQRLLQIKLQGQKQLLRASYGFPQECRGINVLDGHHKNQRLAHTIMGGQ